MSASTTTIDPARRKRMLKNEKAMKLFDKYVGRCSKVVIDWKKFRDLDSKGYFSDFREMDLCILARRHKLEAKGICIKCGKNHAAKDNKLCSACLETQKEYMKKYNSEHKKPKAAKGK